MQPDVSHRVMAERGGGLEKEPEMSNSMFKAVVKRKASVLELKGDSTGESINKQTKYHFISSYLSVGLLKEKKNLSFSFH